MTRTVQFNMLTCYSISKFLFFISLIEATYQKAEVLYQMGRFEEALVFYHKGVQQRPDMDLFHQGIRKSQEAIEVSLGGNVQYCTVSVV